MIKPNLTACVCTVFVCVCVCVCVCVWEGERELANVAFEAYLQFEVQRRMMSMGMPMTCICF